MDKEILTRFLNRKIILINDEHFALHGKITGIYEDYIEFFTDGHVRILDFDRILEIRPYGGR